MSSSSREAILARIKQALSRPSPIPDWTHGPPSTAPLFHFPASDERSLRARMREELTAIMGEYFESDSLADASGWFERWVRESNIKRVAAIDTPLLRSTIGKHAGAEWFDATAQSTKGWEKFDLGVTPCESLVAESGTIMVSAGISGRALSVLPPIHLVIATADQLVADLDAAIVRWREKYGDDRPSTASFITGPSRTADIEKILVLGAHGPRRLGLLVLPSMSPMRANHPPS